MKKILIINPFGIGDVLFTTPLVRTLKDIFPQAGICYLANRRSAAVLADNPNIERVFIYERDEFQQIRNKSFFFWVKSNLAFLKQLKNEHFDIVFDFSLNSQYGFFSWYAGIKQRIGYDFKNRGRFLTKKIRLSGYRDKHIVEYYGDLMMSLNIELKHKDLELYINKDDVEQANRLLEQKGIKDGELLVGVIPGAGRSWGKQASFKHWLPERFAELSDKIVEKYKAKIIMMGDVFEKELSQSVLSHMHQKAIDLTGSTSIGVLAALLKRMKLVITNDGGPLHMAVAVGTKTVSIFGPVSEAVYGPYPYSDKHIVVKADIGCRPCYKDFRIPPCESERICMQGIDTDKVFSAVEKLL